jgi:mannitol operon repressor
MEEDEFLAGMPERFRKLHAVLDELERESDRGVAILGVSMLDQRLKELLEHLLVPCPQTSQLLKGPFSSFANRLTLAVATGLIGLEEFEECNRLRNIRNDFAHKFEIDFSFADARVKGFCTQLNFYYKDITDEEEDDSMATESTDEKSKSPRELFIRSIAEVYMHWLIREYHTQHRRMVRSGLDSGSSHLDSKPMG